MFASPREGTPSYSEGFAPPPYKWADRGRVRKLGEKIKVPAGPYDDVLVIEEFNEHEPGAPTSTAERTQPSAERHSTEALRPPRDCVVARLPLACGGGRQGVPSMMRDVQLVLETSSHHVNFLVVRCGLPSRPSSLRVEHVVGLSVGPSGWASAWRATPWRYGAPLWA
jgi:hypothetical protein